MNSANLRSIALTIGSFLLTLSASAHPGHDFRDAAPQHLLTSPDHLAVLALGGVTLWLTGRFVQRNLPRYLLQGAGVAALLASAVLWGLRA